MDEDRMQALGGLIDEVDAAGPPTPEQAKAQAEEQQQAQALDTATQEWGSVAYMIGGALAMLAPELRQVYTQDACMAWGGSAALVAQKYGWNSPAAAPELGLIVATAGFAVPSYLAISRRLADMRGGSTAQELSQPRQGQGLEGAMDGAALPVGSE